MIAGFSIIKINLIRFYYLLDQLKVNENEDHLLIIKKIIKNNKKNKKN